MSAPTGGTRAADTPGAGTPVADALVETTDHLAQLSMACAALEAGRLDDVFRALEATDVAASTAGSALLEAARGLRLESEGDPAEAMSCMERALFLDVPIPVLVRELARFFQRRGRPMLAHHALLAVDVLDPGLSPASTDALPMREWARHAPRSVRTRLREGKQLTYHAAPFKTALVERLGPEGAAMTVAAMADGEGPRRAARLPLVPLIDHARAEGHDYAEAISEETVPSDPPHVFGKPRGEPFTKRTRTLFTCALDDVVVASKSNVLFPGDVALLDVQGSELARRPDLGVDPSVVVRDGEDLLVTEPRDRDALRSVPEAIWLTGVHSWAFGHWIVEFLPKVWALMEQPGLTGVPVLIDEGMPAQHEEALRVFLGEDRPVITLRRQERVRVGRLWVASQLVYLPVGPRPRQPRKRGGRALHPEGFAHLMARAHARLKGVDTRGAPPRIYLTRKLTQHRQMRNAAAIEALLRQHGFEPIDFGDIPFREQVRLIRGAEQVIGQDGSAMLMTILGRPGLRIGGFSQPQLEEWEWYTDASAALGQEVTVLLGDLVEEHPQYGWMSDYEVDPQQVAAYLAGVESGEDTALPEVAGPATTRPRELHALPVVRPQPVSRVLLDEAGDQEPDRVVGVPEDLDLAARGALDVVGTREDLVHHEGPGAAVHLDVAGLHVDGAPGAHGAAAPVDRHVITVDVQGAVLEEEQAVVAGSVIEGQEVDDRR
ncbi:hypothetical protein BH23CHL8_BH23CHL8_14630 [soil metagenome]